MSPHNLIKSAMTGLKKARAPHLPLTAEHPQKAADGPGTPRRRAPHRRARRRTPGSTHQVPANPDRDDGRSTGAHLQQ